VIFGTSGISSPEAESRPLGRSGRVSLAPASGRGSSRTAKPSVKTVAPVAADWIACASSGPKMRCSPRVVCGSSKRLSGCRAATVLCLHLNHGPTTSASATSPRTGPRCAVPAPTRTSTSTHTTGPPGSIPSAAGTPRVRKTCLQRTDPDPRDGSADPVRAPGLPPRPGRRRRRPVLGTGQRRPDRLDETAVRIGDDQLRQPAGAVLGRGDLDTKDLPMPVSVDPRGDRRDRRYRPWPASTQPRHAHPFADNVVIQHRGCL
jgi:hypothetical protein